TLAEARVARDRLQRAPLRSRQAELRRAAVEMLAHQPGQVAELVRERVVTGYVHGCHAYYVLGIYFSRSPAVGRTRTARPAWNLNRASLKSRREKRRPCVARPAYGLRFKEAPSGEQGRI